MTARLRASEASPKDEPLARRNLHLRRILRPGRESTLTAADRARGAGEAPGTPNGNTAFRRSLAILVTLSAIASACSAGRTDPVVPRMETSGCDLAGRKSVREFSYWRVADSGGMDRFRGDTAACELAVADALATGIPDPRDAASVLIRNRCLEARGWQPKRLGCDVPLASDAPACALLDGQSLCAPGPGRVRPQPVWVRSEGSEGDGGFAADHDRCLGGRSPGAAWQETERCMRAAGWSPALLDGLRGWPGIYTLGIAPDRPLECLQDDGWIACPPLDLRSDPLQPLAPFWAGEDDR